MAPSECHGSNCRWGNGIFTPSFKSGGEVASSPLNQGEEHCQAFSKEGGAGNQGGTDNLLSRGNVRQVHPAAKWDSVRGQVPHYQQPTKCCQHRQAFSKEGGAGNMLHKLMSSAMAPSMCHGSNYKWDNGILTPSFNREGEVASIPPLCIPLKQRGEHHQAFTKEEGAGNQGGTDNLMSRGNVRQVHPAAKWDSVSGQVPHSQQPIKCCQQVRPGECHEQGRQDLTAIEDHQLPPHVRGPEDLRPPHDGAESSPPPETSTNADCQVQFAQQQLLQQGDRHANGHVNVLRQVQYKTVKLCKTLTFTNQSDKKLVPVTTFNFVKVALLTQLEELLIRNRAM